MDPMMPEQWNEGRMHTADLTSCEPLFEPRHVINARRLNNVLRLLPRYHTHRRWNAKLINLLIKLGQGAVPSRWFHDRPVAEATITANGRTVGLRILRPDGAPRGAYIHFHGGAWVIGNARLDDGLTSMIAKECGLLVVGVDFHNATDDRLSDSLNDCEAALEWVLENLSAFNVQSVVVGGESSGAHLAAQALLRLRRSRGLKRVSAFVSTCGAFNLTGSPSLRHAGASSLIVSGPSAYLNLERLRPDLENEERDGPRFASLHDMPPALIVAGELDPILDDSLEMYRSWLGHNGNARLVVVPQAPHGFNRLPTAVAATTNAYIRRWIPEQIGLPC
jgi:acetyl esterase/lipase